MSSTMCDVEKKILNYNVPKFKAYFYNINCF